MSGAYWAGVLDSDGSLTVSCLHKTRTNPHYQAVFQLSWTANNKSKGALDELVRTYGGSYCRCRSSGPNQFKNGKAYFKYCLTGKKLQNFLLDVVSHLRLKEQQAYNLLAVLDLNEENKFRPRNKEKAKKLNVLYRYNRMLNTKNRPQVTS